MCTSYFVTFQHGLWQLQCTWSSVSSKVWFRDRRIIVLGLPASHLFSNTNTNGEYGGWQSSSSRHFGWQPVLELTCDQVHVLAPSDLYLFPELREFMKGHKFSDDQDIICTSNGWLEDQEQQFFYNGIRALDKSWTKCIAVAEDYVEKWQNMMWASCS